MPRSTKPRPKSVREVADEMIGEKAYFTDERPPVEKHNRGNDVSTKGDRVKDVSISIMDIDTAIVKYIEEKIQPAAIQDGNRIQVPVMYGYPERWATIQEKGYLREYSGRMMAPVIVVKRDSLEANRSLGTKIDANNPQNLHVFETGYTRKNQYDNFNVLSNRNPVKEYRLVVMPEYVTLTYSAVIFTNHLEQNNKIIEAFKYAENTYWGESGRFQFRARIDSFSTSTEYSAGDDRTTRTNFTITLNGYIIPDTVNRDISYPKKFLSKAQVIFTLETEGVRETDYIRFGGIKQKGPIFGPGSTISYVDTTNAVVDYLASVITKNGPGELAILNSSTIRVLNSSIAIAPSPLPATDKTQFNVVINTTYIPNNLITSVTQNGSNVDIVIDITSLYSLLDIENLYSVSVIGKFA
jgi:hypothetical protein